jgi:NADH:ubiquinone oxidoreductase subunit F (NADH-binding)
MVRQHGHGKSKGTKTFAVGGNVLKPGLIEVPMGITLREIIFDVAGGIKDGRKFKAVQTGGPMGGCLTDQHLDLPLDYEALTQAGSMMGSGGLVVMDETSCMVDIARFFMDFTQAESCGKCTPCRIGTRRILELLQKICDGKGEHGDIEKLEDLCYEVPATVCAGWDKARPSRSSARLKHFRHEYEAHIYEKRCPAKVCRH